MVIMRSELYITSQEILYMCIKGDASFHIHEGNSRARVAPVSLVTVHLLTASIHVLTASVELEFVIDSSHIVILLFLTHLRSV